MNVYEAVMNRRTVRKFTPQAVKREDILKIIDCARMSAFGANMQPLKFAVIDGENANKVYPFTKWAGYISGWEPDENERPSAYIAILADTEIKPAEKTETDSGAAVTSMMLEALELGLGSCWLGAINREGIKEALNIDEKYHVTYLLALGYPAQTGEVFNIQDNNVKYYFDENENVHVPKRTLDEVIVEI